MTPWTATRERRAIVAHIARCSFCQALISYGQRRQDRAVLDAADQLAYNHANADEERLAFTRRARLPLRAARSEGSLRPLPARDGSAILVREAYFLGGAQ